MSRWRPNDRDELLDSRPPTNRPGADLLARLSANNTMLADPSDPDASPSRMQRPEDQVGYGVAIAIVIIGIIFAVVHGKGSPKHPHTYVEIAGIVVAALTPLAIFRYANRFVSAIMIVVSSLLISIVRPPNKWIGLYYLMLVGSLGYAFWLTRHQSKAARVQTMARRSDTTGRNRTQQSSQARGKRRKGEEQIVPTQNRRYTPPKAPRERPKRSEVAAAPVPTVSRRKQRQEARRAEPKDSKAR